MNVSGVIQEQLFQLLHPINAEIQRLQQESEAEKYKRPGEAGKGRKESE